MHIYLWITTEDADGDHDYVNASMTRCDLHAVTTTGRHLWVQGKLGNLSDDPPDKHMQHEKSTWTRRHHTTSRERTPETSTLSVLYNVAFNKRFNPLIYVMKSNTAGWFIN
jgi:hypothetical protein